MEITNLPELFGLSQLPLSSYEFGGKAFTTQELWVKIAEKINILIEHFNYLDKNVSSKVEATQKKLDYLLGEGLAEQVARKIMLLVEDGTLANIINNDLFKDINSNISNISTILDKKSNISNKHVDVINETNDTIGGLNIANFAGQGQSTPPIGNVLHNYTDGINLQIDNVGENNTILVLKNANNPSRRPDKPADFIGSGNFIECIKHKPNNQPSMRIFQIDDKGCLYWFDVDDTVNFGTNKTDNGKYCFSLQSFIKNEKIFYIANGYEYILEIKDKNGEVLIDSSSNRHLNLNSANNLILNASNEVVIDKVPIINNNGVYVKPLLNNEGTSSQRPSNPKKGEYFYDTTINSPIWFDGNNWLRPTMSQV